MGSGQLSGRTAIVTGAGRGIGRGIAEAFAEEGAQVVVASRSASTVEAAVASIEARGGRALGLTCDVGDRDQVFAMVDRTIGHFGALDILVNNAQGMGAGNPPSHHPSCLSIEELLEEEWEYTLRTGLFGTMWAMKAAFPHLKRNGGKVINFGSPAGQIGLAGHAPYVATKEAIRGLSRTAARDWGKYRINVNVINPGIITEALQEWIDDYPEDSSEQFKQLPLGQFGSPADAGKLAIFLASSASDFLTGGTFNVDGGYVITP